MEGWSFSELLSAFGAVVCLLGAYNTILTAIKHHRSEKERRTTPVNGLARLVQQHDRQLKRDHQRISETEAETRMIMRAIMALLSHEINGNSIDKLTQSLEELNQYLIAK